MIPGQGASPVFDGISTMLEMLRINDRNLVFSVHTYQPTNFPEHNSLRLGSASDVYQHDEFRHAAS